MRHATTSRKTVLVVTVNCRAEKKKERSIYLRILEAFSNLPQTAALRLTDNGDSHDPKAAFNRALHMLVGRFVPYA